MNNENVNTANEKAYTTEQTLSDVKYCGKLAGRQASLRAYAAEKNAHILPKLILKEGKDGMASNS